MVSKRNQFFKAQDGTASEQAYVESMNIEAIQIAGIDCVYLPRTLNKFDQLFGEDTLSSFNSHAVVECWVSDYTGFGGEGEMIAKFGLEIRDTCTIVIARARFTEEVVPIVPSNREPAVAWRPNEGDLIFIPNSKSLFEIKFVEDEEPSFYQLNKKFVWSIRCELTQLNNETFNTGHTEIDELYGENMNRLNNSIDDEAGFDFILEEGGEILTEVQTNSKPYTDVMGYGDDSELKQEFLEIMDLTKKNPLLK